MSSHRPKIQPNTPDLPLHVAPSYPTWVTECLNQQIDAAIARYKVDGPIYRSRSVQQIKHRPH